jgi:hypothetical protein
MLLLVSTNAFGEATVDAMRSQLWQKPDDNITVYGNYMPSPADRKPGVRTPFDLNADRGIGGEPANAFGKPAHAAATDTEPTSGDSMQDVATDLLKSRALDFFISMEIAKLAAGHQGVALAVYATLALWPTPAH